MFERRFFSKISRIIFSSTGILYTVSKERTAARAFFFFLQTVKCYSDSWEYCYQHEFQQTAILIPNVIAHLLPCGCCPLPAQNLRTKQESHESNLLLMSFRASLTLNVPLARAQLSQELACDTDLADTAADRWAELQVTDQGSTLQPDLCARIPYSPGSWGALLPTVKPGGFLAPSCGPFHLA